MNRGECKVGGGASGFFCLRRFSRLDLGSGRGDGAGAGLLELESGESLLDLVLSRVGYGELRAGAGLAPREVRMTTDVFGPTSSEGE